MEINNNIQEQYLNFVNSEILSEKGFDISTNANWWILSVDEDDDSKKFFAGNNDELEDIIFIDEEKTHNILHVLSVPTIQLAVDWIYENFKIWINVEMTGACLFYAKFRMIDVDGQHHVGHFKENGETIRYKTPESAYQAAIHQTLTKLI